VLTFESDIVGSLTDTRSKLQARRRKLLALNRTEFLNHHRTATAVTTKKLTTQISNINTQIKFTHSLEEEQKQLKSHQFESDHSKRDFAFSLRRNQ